MSCQHNAAEAVNIGPFLFDIQLNQKVRLTLCQRCDQTLLKVNKLYVIIVTLFDKLAYSTHYKKIKLLHNIVTAD